MKLDASVNQTHEGRSKNPINILSSNMQCCLLD